MKLASRSEKIDYLLKVVLDKGQANEIAFILIAKFGEECRKECFDVVRELEDRKMIKKDSQGLFIIDIEGRNVLSVGGYDRYEASRIEKEDRENEIKSTNLEIAKKTLKNMSLSLFIGVIGGVVGFLGGLAGLLSLYIQLKEPQEFQTKKTSTQTKEIPTPSLSNHRANSDEILTKDSLKIDSLIVD